MDNKKQKPDSSKGQGQTKSKKASSTEESPKKEAQQATKEAPKKASSTEESPKKEAQQAKEKAKLSGLYAFKLKMASLYDENGHQTPVTFLKFEPWVVSQVKTQKKEGYNSVQIACQAQKNNRVSKALQKHLTSAGF